MNIIKVESTRIHEFQKDSAFIRLLITPTENYYLVEETKGFEIVETMPNISNIVAGDLESIIKHASYMSNLKVQENINDLQRELEQSDYKIIKSYEYAMVGLEQPYNVAEIHTERENLRNQINYLQSQIKPVKTWEELQNIVMDNRTI